MTEKPIIMAGESVRAILENRKTVSRRVVKPQPVFRDDVNDPTGITHNGWWWTRRDGTGIHSQPTAEDLARVLQRSPYFWPYREGMRFWVREGFAIMPRSAYGHCPNQVDPANPAMIAVWREGWERSQPGPWKSPIFMPRWASRLTLEVTGVRVERLQATTPRDCAAEGIMLQRWIDEEAGKPLPQHDPGEEADGEELLQKFRKLWDRLNAKRGFGWDVNPWVWKVEFRRIEL